MVANRNRFVRGPRRKMMWVRRKNVHTGSLGFAEDCFVDFRAQQGTINNPSGLTVIREIVSVYYRAVATDDTITEFFLGMIVAPNGEIPANAAMRNAPGEDWMLHDYTAFVQERQQGSPTQNLMKSKHWDLSGQRKRRVLRTDPCGTPILNSSGWETA